MRFRKESNSHRFHTANVKYHNIYKKRKPLLEQPKNLKIDLLKGSKIFAIFTATGFFYHYQDIDYILRTPIFHKYCKDCSIDNHHGICTPSINQTIESLKNIYSINECGKLTKLLYKSNYISLYGQSISNLKPLSEFRGVTKLELSLNNISDLSPLKNLRNIEVLDISHNRITNLKPLKNLDKISFLNLENNWVNDLEVLSDKINLRQLNINDNLIKNISPIKKLVRLKSLHVAQNKISDISSLKGLVNVTSLNVKNNYITDFSVIESLKIRTIIGRDHQINPFDKFQLNHKKVTEVDKHSGFMSCAICLSEYEINDDISEISCQHIFHSNCLKKWIKISQNCPYCRQIILLK